MFKIIINKIKIFIRIKSNFTLIRQIPTMKYFSLSIIFILLLNCSCKKTEHHQVIRSFCYWKTNFNINNYEDNPLIDSLKTTHMYVRFFDIGWNPLLHEALPIETINELEIGERSIQITPSIYITNEVIQQLNNEQLDTLCSRIIKRIEQIKTEKLNYYLNRNNPHNKLPQVLINDLLIDCDWTEKTRDKYFYLLKALKKSDYKISATIRLWQYKYMSKAGIPPVDRGLLMCYNMEDIKNYNAKNTIGSYQTLKSYLTHDEYQLKLDIALPIYSWTLLYTNKEFNDVCKEIDRNIISDTLNFKQLSENKYQAIQDLEYYYCNIRNGDIIKIDLVNDKEMKDMIELIKDKIKIDNLTRVTFFSYDKSNINNYGIKNINRYYESF